jgi:hypothetical protein
VYTAYRDSDTIFSSKDLASGVYELWQKKGATNIAEVRIDLQQGLSSGVVPSLASMGAVNGFSDAAVGYRSLVCLHTPAGIAPAEERG